MMKTRCLFSFLILFLLCSGSVCAQLPPAAQEALDNGIIAAKVPDYVLAIRYFEEARKIAPDAPVIYFNLGLAESKIPGRELRAICWFSAFLAADPNSPNAASVKEQIQILKIKSQSNISRLITNLQDAAIKMRTPMGHGLDGIAGFWAKSGDIQAAFKAVTLADDDSRRDGAYSEIAYAQAKAGDIPGAVKTAAMIKKIWDRTHSFLNIAAVQIENGDLAGTESSIAEAKRAADLETNWSKAHLLTEVGQMQIKAGNMTGARSTLKEAAAVTDLNWYSDDTITKIHTQSPIAESQIAAGDLEGAKQTLLMAFRNSELITEPKKRLEEQGLFIIRYQSQAGDIKNALKTFDSFQKAYNQTSDNSTKNIYKIDGFYGRGTIITAQIKAGDFAGALKMANEMTDANSKSSALQDIAIGQAKTGDFAGMSKIVNEITDPEKKAQQLWWISNQLAEVSNFDGAGKIADMIQETSNYKGYAISNIAEKRGKAGDFAGLSKMVNEMSDAEAKSNTRSTFAIARARVGDFAGAFKITAEITDQGKKDITLYNIVVIQSEARDFDSARKTAEMIQKNSYKDFAAKKIAEERAKPAPTSSNTQPTTSPITAKDWIQRISYLEANYFTDLPGYLKNLPADNADKMYDELFNSASKMVDQQSFISKALKRKPTEQPK
jgi:tetratricopeptide (TPR) repeat protein